MFKFRANAIETLEEFYNRYGKENTEVLLNVEANFFGELTRGQRKVADDVAILDGISEEVLDNDHDYDTCIIDLIRDFRNAFLALYSDDNYIDNIPKKDDYLDFVLINPNPVLDFSSNTNFVTCCDSLEILRYAKRNNLKFDLIVGDFDDYMLLSNGQNYKEKSLKEYLDLVSSVLAPYGIFLWTAHGGFINKLDPFFSQNLKNNYKGYIYFKNKATSSKNNGSLRTDEIAVFLSDNSLGSNHRPFIEVSKKKANVYYNNGLFYEFVPFRKTSKTRTAMLEAKQVISGNLKDYKKHFYTIIAKSSKNNPKIIDEYKICDDFKYECVAQLIADDNLAGLNHNYKYSVEDYNNMGYDIVVRPSLSKNNKFFGFSKEMGLINRNLANFSANAQTTYAYIKDFGLCNLRKMTKTEVNKYLVANGLKDELIKSGDGSTKQYYKESIQTLRNHIDLTKTSNNDTELISFVAVDPYLDDDYFYDKKPNAIRSVEGWEMMLSHLQFRSKNINVLDLSAGIGQLERALLKYSEETDCRFNYVACENNIHTYHHLKFNMDDISSEYLELGISELHKSEMCKCNQNEIAPYLLKNLGEEKSLCFIDKSVDVSRDIENLSTKISHGITFICSYNLAIDLYNHGVEPINIVLDSDVHRKEYL